MMRRIAATAFVGGLISMTISGCSSSGPTAVKVDDHVFDVPQKHLVQGTIPWLPASQSDALKFIVNPEADVEEQMIVTMESTATTCHPTSPPASTQLASVCADATDIGEDAGHNFVLEKVLRDGDPTQWEYRLKDRGTVVASCYALSDDKTGLCTSLSRYNDLVYSVGLRDSDVVRLPAIREKVISLLQSWERAGSDA